MCTSGTILRVISWSLNALASGVYPACDHNGEPFLDELTHLVLILPPLERNYPHTLIPTIGPQSSVRVVRSDVGEYPHMGWVDIFPLG